MEPPGAVNNISVFKWVTVVVIVLEPAVPELISLSNLRFPGLAVLVISSELFRITDPIVKYTSLSMKLGACVKLICAFAPEERA